MAKTEDFRAPISEAQTSETRATLADAAFAPPASLENGAKASVTRVADTGWVPIGVGGTTQQGDGTFRGAQGTTFGGWKPVNPDTWPKTMGSDAPAGPNGVQWNGGKPDYSRGPGGVVFQPRPTDFGNPQPITGGRADGTAIAPIVVEATRDGTGKWVGPTILPDVPRYQNNPPSDKGRPGGLVERDGVLVDERSEEDKFHAELDLVGFIGGAFIGMVKGGLKGGIAGGVIGVVAAELLKPLNPFRK